MDECEVKLLVEGRAKPVLREKKKRKLENSLENALLVSVRVRLLLDNTEATRLRSNGRISLSSSKS